MKEEYRQHRRNMLAALSHENDPRMRRFLTRSIADYDELEQFGPMSKLNGPTRDDADELAIWQGDLGSRDLLDEE